MSGKLYKYLDYLEHSGLQCEKSANALPQGLKSTFFEGFFNGVAPEELAEQRKKTHKKTLTLR